MMLKPFSLITVLAMFMTLFVGVVHAEDSIVNQYDPNGNLVSGDGKYYEYNDANKLVRVRENSLAGAVIAEYFYDYAGQRVKKVENGVTSYYIGKYYETQVVAGQAKDTAHFFVDNERVAKRDASGTYFYHPDHLGGTNVVTNAVGALVARNSYLPFGEMREGGQEKYSYTGKEKDAATDLYYFESRFNSPELRHFTQADIAEPDLSDPQDLNRYAYVGNNPLSYVDPDGHKKKKKAKLSKREKFMIAHGVDPDHDKTSLKKAKKQEKAGTKYTVAAKAATSSVSGGQAGAEYILGAGGASNTGRVLGASTQADDSNDDEINNLKKNTAIKVVKALIPMPPSFAFIDNIWSLFTFKNTLIREGNKAQIEADNYINQFDNNSTTNCNSPYVSGCVFKHAPAMVESGISVAWP